MKKTASSYVIPKLDRAVEELVLQARLKTIEREHKSIGTIIDKREMFVIDDSIGNPFKANQDKNGNSSSSSSTSNLLRENPLAADQPEEPLIESRRNNVLLNVDASQKALGIIMKQEAFAGSTGSLLDEEMMWKSKSSNPNYTLKRKYNHPELADFFENMNLEQKQEFKQRCNDLFTKIVMKLRKECSKLKTEMDYAGIFHPSANAQRAHCLYLGKLNKMIDAQNIEDVVIRTMRNAVIEKQRLELEEEEKRDQLIRFAELGKKGKDFGRPTSQGNSNNSSDHNDNNSSINNNNNNNNNNNDSGDASSISKEGAALDGCNPVDGPNKNDSAGDNHNNYNSDINGNNYDGNIKNNNSNSTNSGNINNINNIDASHEGGKANENDKLGKKGGSSSNKSLAHDKHAIGNKNAEKITGHSRKASDSKLGSDKAEKALGPVKKRSGSLSKDNLHKKILEGEASNTTANAAGDSNNNNGGGLHSSNTEGSNKNSNNNSNNNEEDKNSQDEEKDEKVNFKMDRDSEKLFSKIKRGKLGAADPREILVEEYEKLNYVEQNLVKKKYSDHSDVLDTEMMRFIIGNLQEQQIHKMTDGGQVVSNQMANVPVASDQIVSFDDFYEMFNKYASQVGPSDIPHQSQNNQAGSKVSLISSPAHSMKQGGGGINVNITQASAVNNITSTTYSASYDMAPTGSGTSSAAAIANTGASDGKGQEGLIDLMAEMSAKDKHFDAFLKISLRDKPTGRRLFNPNQKKLLKPKKIRNVPPLGEDCMQVGALVRGKRQDALAPGFTNYFKEDSMGNTEEEEDEPDEASAVSRSTQDTESKELAATTAANGIKNSFGLPGAGLPQSLYISSSTGNINNSDSGINGGSSSVVAAVSSSSQASPTPKTPKQSRVKSRSRGRSKTPTGEDVDRASSAGGAKADAPSYMDAQTKLNTIWSTLQVSHTKKLEFMRKYCTDGYATQLPYCLLMWSSAAILALAKIQLIKLKKKLDKDYLVFPLIGDDLVSSFIAAIPPELLEDNMQSTFLDNKGLPYENVQTISELISTLKVDIHDVYETFPTGIHTMEDAKLLVKSLKTLLDEKLISLAKKTFDDIEDTLVFISSPFRDWINMDGFTPPPPPPKDAPKPSLF